MVRGSWLKPGAVVIDVGINPVEVSGPSQLFLGWPHASFFLDVKRS